MKASLVALVAALTVCVAVLGAVARVTANRSDDASRAMVVPHRHFLQTPSGLTEVGPRACDDPAARDAFARFHARIHAMPPQGRRVAITTRACSITR